MSVNQIFYVVMGIISVVVTGIIIPLIHKRTTKTEIDNVLAMVDIAVKAAEQIYNQRGQGDLKKRYVLEYLQNKGIKISEEDLNNMLESSVFEINKWKEELKNKPTVNVINKEVIKPME